LIFEAPSKSPIFQSTEPKKSLKLETWSRELLEMGLGYSLKAT